MPAKSVKQQQFFAWALHHPDQARAEGKLPDMPKTSMRDFAATSTTGLPTRKKKKFYGE